MKTTTTLFLLLCLAACRTDPKTDTGELPGDPVDADGDGWTAEDDCDDSDPEVNPGADELCNGLDDDCDGEVDEDADGATVWHADTDGDGHGDGDSSVTACEMPSGYVADDSDCDDTDAGVNPESEEICDGVDNDCDGVVDGEGAVDATAWYADADEDGYGDPDSEAIACEAPSGHVEDATDCDDADPGVNPAAAELCDGIDNDCDGEIDEDAAGDAPTWYADADGDGFGDLDSTTTACALPSGYTDDATDCDDTEAAVNPAADELCDGVDNDCDLFVDEDDALDAPTWYADADGDGFGDPDLPSAACAAPSGTVADATDCDDAVAAVNPDATEICDGVDNDCDGAVDEDDASDASSWYADADGDGYGDAGSTTAACSVPSGYTADDTDCDDGDAAVSPGDDELCDGIDNDCDGDVDEDSAVDAATWYADADGDGYGDAGSTAVACSAPSGHVSDDTDCDDTTADAHPAATESCDGIDNDCDGAVDEDDAVDASTWYADADGDGYGDAASTTAACSEPSGYTADATDCDDGEAAVNPAATESCDAIDNDCDGSVDEDSAADAATWYADGDGDGYGDAASTTVSCEGPTGYVATDTDCDDGAAAVSPAATESCDGVDNDCDGTVDEDDASDASTWYADADGDGYGDASSSTAACSGPTGYVLDDTDCDDGDAAVNPAAAESCDGFDNDCDGTVDEDSASDASTWYADGDGDGYGDASSSTTACSGPTGYVSDATDCDDGDAGISPAASEVVDGLDNDCDGAGLDGDYAPTASETLASGPWEFTTVDIPSGVTVTVSGSDLLEIYVLEDATIAGWLDLAGEDGTDGGVQDGDAAAGGLGGGGGGGDGGDGSIMWYTEAGSGSGTGGGTKGEAATTYYMCGGGGGGAGHAVAGDDGEDGYYSGTSGPGGAGGAAYGSDSSAALLAGSGGGGGGAGVAANGDGSAGGGGGGALYLDALEILVSGTIDASGGDGGGDPTGYDGGGGGAGSGGTIWLAAEDITVSGALYAEGGLGGETIEGSRSGRGGYGGDAADGRIWLDADSVDDSGTCSPSWLVP